MNPIGHRDSHLWVDGGVLALRGGRCGRPLAALRRLCWGLCLAAAAGWAPGGEVLVLNSDRSVERYAAAQSAFEQSLGQSSVPLDVADAKLDASGIERIIRQRQPDVIYCIGSKAYLLAAQSAKDRTLVVSSTLNVKRLPLGRQTYGVANELLPATQLNYFKYFFPRLKRIGILYNARYNQQWVDEAAAAGADLDIEVVASNVSRAGQVNRAAENLVRKIDALWLIPDPVILATAESVESAFSRAEEARVPVFSYNESFLELGPVLVVAPDTPTIGRQAAGLVAELIQRKTPLERIREPAGSEIILNLRRVSQYGLTLNEDALAIVNQVIR